MTKYLLRRLLHGLLSVIVVVAIVMIMIYSLTDREKIFGYDPLFSKRSSNQKITYKYEQWEKFGYLDYVTYSDYLYSLYASGMITEEERAEAVKFAPESTPLNDPANRLIADPISPNDSPLVAKYVREFTEYYESRGYKVLRYNADYYSQITKKLNVGGKQLFFAYKDVPLTTRLLSFFGRLFSVDNVHYVDSATDIGERKLTFTLYDPLYNANGEKKFSPAIIGNGTRHKYLVYFDGDFPYFHQNVFTVRLGLSYNINKGVDVFETMTQTQGKYIKSMVTYPTGLVEESADDLHSATYVEGSRELSDLISSRFTDDYTGVSLHLQSSSKMGYSFIMGILSSILAYLLGVPLGILMAKNKDKLIDKIGTCYIIFIIAVPSLAYIFMFQAIGSTVFKLPRVFDVTNENWLMYVLPIISLALPSIAGLMRWLRRYMIDQMNSDYVRFARSNGLSEGEIFSKHIFKNAAIPIVHGVPGTILGALNGAIITERVYHVPGAGGLLTNAINASDNGVIVGLTLFFALLSIISMILGDILMGIVDPRISFSTSKAR